MGKERYHFNTASLKIEKVQMSLRDRLKKISWVMLSGLVFGVLTGLLLYTFIDSPKELMMKRELEQTMLQYQIINDRLDQVSDVLNDMHDRDDNIYRVIFEAEPIPSAIRKAGFGGADRYARLQGFKNSDLMINTTQKLDRITSQLVVQSRSFDEVFKMARNKEMMLSCIPAIQPLSNKELKRLSSFFGYRTDPIYKVKKFHSGIDFSAPEGTEVYATGDGVVEHVSRSRRGYGNLVVINHGYTYSTAYAHMRKFIVRKGQKVSRGEVIGYVGNTGKSTAPHLHYEVRKNGKAVNPIHYFFNDLSPEQFDEVLELSMRPTQTLD